MYFITNRTPDQGPESKAGRALTFSTQNTVPLPNIYFCERPSEGEYLELGATEFFSRLKTDNPRAEQVLFYIHGFNNTPEREIFPNAKILQELMGETSIVIPFIWPCDDDSVLHLLDDYWDDQEAASDSAKALARALGKFMQWRDTNISLSDPCFRRMNILAHSMGGRVLTEGVAHWVKSFGGGSMPRLFSNIFMVAADVTNDIFEAGEDGRHLADAANRVLTFHASDDWAMPASKLANIRRLTISRRLGLTGPEDIEKTPKNVFAFDCSRFNNEFDPKGHTYFLKDERGNGSPVAYLVRQCIESKIVDLRGPLGRESELPRREPGVWAGTPEPVD
ncbi:alpha/beta hydrolase [Microbulbifer aggregans]|uniref:alpha/beta hydrolase n=1 Tax=Microbulbifer aggregans TaxID=1769779 RepID=UPI001CFF354A|nr:alpha/beta hydrolase [Microbulbifer aggregans]